MKDKIPVLITTGKHKGLVIMHTPEEYKRLWAGVDRQAAKVLGKP